MRARQPKLPLLWLLSDARNDAMLEGALDALPPNSGFVFRHYHLDPEARAARFKALAAIARRSRHMVILADAPGSAVNWGADGVYGTPASLSAAYGMVRLASAHDGAELAEAGRMGAAGVFLSPVYPTASHPTAPPLGIHGFHVLAQQSRVPVIALGGMTKTRADELAWPRWGAIDGLASPQPA